ncbi:uncharacterized protein DEA37_0009245, partial [Paragonimus westermani]
TSDIPPIEEILNLKLTHTDALPLITQQAPRPKHKVDHYGTVGHNAYARSPKNRRRNVNTCFQATFPSLIENELSLTSTPVTTRLSSQCISEPVDPKYTSTMWCRLVELWSNLLNEERQFWRTQVQQLFLRSSSNNQKDSNSGKLENDASMLIELLDKTNRRHTEQTVALWKHIYESWVPHDYLDYFADETRKNLTCLHVVINRLFELIDNARQTGGSEPLLFDRQLMDLKKQLTWTHESLAGFAMSNPGGDRVNSCSSGVLETASPNALSHAQSKMSQLSSDSWQQTRMLLKESHSQLLEQVYNVAEMVGTALDVDMEDSISGAQKLQEKLASADPLSSLPTTGLQVAAKLQAVVLDLETRLEAMCQQDTAVGNSTQLGQQQQSQSTKESSNPLDQLKPEVDSRTNGEAMNLRKQSGGANVISGQPPSLNESTNGGGSINVWSRNVQKFYGNDI